jgi:L-threonylcarbamoyladenylate synthase
VSSDLGDDIDVLLDGGECDVGVESTILDLTSEIPRLLRPGGVTVEQLESLLGVSVSRTATSGARAPGLLPSHYAPNARVLVVPRAELVAQAQALLAAGERVAVLASHLDDRDVIRTLREVIFLDLGSDASAAAHRLYGALRDADARAATVVLASPPVADGLGEALADRLKKAAGPRTPP